MNTFFRRICSMTCLCLFLVKTTHVDVHFLFVTGQSDVGRGFDFEYSVYDGQCCTCMRGYLYVKPCRGTCLRRPLGTRRPPRLFETIESYYIKLASLITRYSVLIYCAKENN